MLYNIAMIQHYSRCVIRQLLWLRFTYPNAWFRLGFYMCSLQELSANWLLPQAPDRSVPGARETYYMRIPWQRTTSHLTRALRYRGILMYKVLPRWNVTLVDTVADPISGVEVADELFAPVYELMSEHIWLHNESNQIKSNLFLYNIQHSIHVYIFTI